MIIMNKYAKIVLDLMPRILTATDTRRGKTYGCMDRNYWKYHGVFPCARFQEPALTLALLYKNMFKGNPYYKKEKIRELAEAAIRYWASIQNKDGSFNEWYPNERSFVATAFSTYKISEAYMLLGMDGLENNFRKAGEWLSKQKDYQPANQIAGAIAALYNIYLADSYISFQAWRKVKEFKHNPNGSFDEYGGTDTGYMTVAIDFLAKYWKKINDPLALKLINNALKWLKPNVRKDGSLVVGCRNTKFKLPHGVTIMSKNNKDAKVIADRFYNGIEKTLNPLHMDDRFALQYHTSYLQAALEMMK